MGPLYLIYTVIIIAFLFDFINGFHDAANSTATLIVTGVLKPLHAVLWAAFFNFIAFVFFHLNVASTVGTGLVTPDSLSTYVIFSALSGAVIFSLFTWYFGLPSSSSHALIGGLIGAAVAHHGWQSLIFSGLSKTLIAIVVSPLLGIIFGYSILKLASYLFSRSDSGTKFDKACQLLSAAFLSLGHGANDAQKMMGIIAVTLFTGQLIGPHFYVPLWVVISCNLVMGLGTLAGGYRIVKTLGEKITSLSPQSGAAAQTSSALILFLATFLGIPVSTTHIVTGSIVGVGVEQGKVNWHILHRIVYAWLLTLPATALLAAGIELLHFF